MFKHKSLLFFLIVHFTSTLHVINAMDADIITIDLQLDQLSLHDSLQGLCLKNLFLKDVLEDINNLDLTLSINDSLLNLEIDKIGSYGSMLNDLLSKDPFQRIIRNQFCSCITLIDDAGGFGSYHPLDNKHFISL
jgi:hypothetical protein